MPSPELNELKRNNGCLAVLLARLAADTTVLERVICVAITTITTSCAFCPKPLAQNLDYFGYLEWVVGMTTNLAQCLTQWIFHPLISILSFIPLP